jgi:hypothetical protein
VVVVVVDLFLLIHFFCPCIVPKIPRPPPPTSHEFFGTYYFIFFLCRGIPEATERTPEEYDTICDRIESGVPDVEPATRKRKRGKKKDKNLGVKERCLFNSLKAFHCIGQTPYDFMHDWLEKVAPADCQSILMAFKISGQFSLNDYNQALANLRLEDYERHDRPFPVKDGDKKLAGKALSIALHVRLMPLVITSIVDLEDCELVQFLATVHNINEIMMADCLSPQDAFRLQSLVVKYFTLRQACSEKYPSFTALVPKHHYLEHYPAQILAFGPFTSVWTARYESRHRDFVNWCESSKNFINVLKTLCYKNQKKLASRLGNFTYVTITGTRVLRFV